MFFPKREIIEQLKETYKEGTRVELVYMSDPYVKIPSGTKGTVRTVDDSGTIHVNWDSGNSLGIVYGEDSCKIIE